MKTATIYEIKSELLTLEQEHLVGLCLRLAKFKKENKELLTYLLFELQNEQAYVESIKETMDELFAALPTQNLYLIKKVLRKILRFVNRQLKYSGIAQTEVELRIYFCAKAKEARIPFATHTVLFNLYQQQLNKINAALAKLPEDIQSDYQRDLKALL